MIWLQKLGRRPRPDVHILELGPTGALIQNVGAAPCRCGISAWAGEREVECSPAIVDLPVNSPSLRIRIHGAGAAELVVQVNDGKRITNRTWP